jgi:hypothetical protein
MFVVNDKLCLIILPLFWLSQLSDKITLNIQFPQQDGKNNESSLDTQACYSMNHNQTHAYTL